MFFAISFPICVAIAVISVITAIVKIVKTYKQLEKAKGEKKPKSRRQIQADLHRLNQLLDEYYS